MTKKKNQTNCWVYFNGCLVKQLDLQPNLQEMLIRAVRYRPLIRVSRRRRLELFQFRFLSEPNVIWIHKESNLINNLKISQDKEKSSSFEREILQSHVKGEDSTFTVRCYFNPSTQNGPPPRGPGTIRAPVTNLGCSGSFLEQIYAPDKPGWKSCSNPGCSFSLFLSPINTDWNTRRF